MTKKQKYDTPIRYICSILFASFSFIYIYVFQGKLLALMQDYLSDGITRNNTFLTAILFTLLLMLLQWFINRLSKLHGRWEALSYIPSCMLLALLTDVNDGTMLYSASKWLWCIPACALIYIGVVWLNRMVSVRKIDFFGKLWPNMLTFSLLFVLTAQISNHAPAPHMELAAWHYMHEGKYDRLLEVGRRSDDYNAELTSLRNLAMAKTDQLGNLLFHYPQHYGSDGLLYNRHSKQSNTYGAAEFYSHLGGNTPYGGESGSMFYQRLSQKNDSLIYRNLYLAALLLDKQLPTFVNETADLVASAVSAPLHYQEAWLLYNELHPDAPIPFTASNDLIQQFKAYRALQAEYADNAIIAKNVLLRRFGNTLWFYYDYAD